MVPPLLKLEFTQGPRTGESLEYKPGSTIRIGRIVRGNQIAIKDAGISTKHIRIESDSENWLIHDLGSSNGTILNSDTLDPDTPVNLRHGDTVKLGEVTSILVNFVSDVQAQEHKLPPRPRRNNKRLTVPDSDPDPDPVELVQEKPKRRGRPPKQDNASSKENGDEHELPKRTRASRKRTVEDIADEEKELEAENEKKVNSRVGRPRKKEIMKEEEVPVEKKVNSRVRRVKNTESFQKLDLNSIKLEVEDTPKAVEISDRKRATRSKQIENASLGLENVKSEVTVLEEKDERRTSRATRSKKTEIGGDSFMNLDMVLNQARKSRAKRKKMEQELSKSVVEMEAKNDDTGEEALKNCRVDEEDKDNEAQKGFSGEKEDEAEGSDGSKRVDQVEVELRKSTIGEEDLNCSVREDGETENLQETEEECRDEERKSEIKEAETATLDGDGSKRVEQVELELSKKSTLGEEDLSCTVREDAETEKLQNTNECEVEEAGSDDEENAEQGSSNKNVDLGKMTLGEWFDFMEVQLPKQIIEETEKMIEPMRSKAMRVHKHIAEQIERVL